MAFRRHFWVSIIVVVAGMTPVRSWSGPQSHLVVERRIPPVAAPALRAAATDGARTVAVGDGGRILVTEDGVDWTKADIGTASDLHGVAWGGGRFVAVSPAGAVAVSVDGETWSAGAGPAVRSVVWTPWQEFLAAGEEGLFASGDGVDWGWLQSGSWRAVACNHEKCVAVSNSHTAVSGNGRVWTVAAKPFCSDYSSTFSDVTWAGDRFVAIGILHFKHDSYHYAVMMESTDGSTWSCCGGSHGGIYGGFGEQGRAVAWDGRLFFAGSHGRVQGFVVPGEEAPAGLAFFGLAVTPHGVLLLGEADTIAVWLGDRWQMRHPFDRRGDLVGVASGGGPVVALGIDEVTGEGYAAVAGEGRWQRIALPFPGLPRGVAWSGSEYLVVGDGGGAAVSPDGLSWTPLSPPDTADLAAVACGGPGCVAAGAGGIILPRSPAGDWSTVQASDTDLLAVTWTGDRFVAGGRNGTVLVSADGHHWAPLASARAVDITGLAFDGTTLVAGSGNRLHATRDGRHWTYHPLPYESRASAVAWGEHRFFALGGSKLVHSWDLENWSSGQPYAGSEEPVTAAARGVSGLTLVGRRGLLMEAAPVSRPELSEEADRLTVIPAAAHLPGLAGSRWRSDVIVHNRFATGRQIRVFFLPAGRDNRSAQGFEWSLNPFETIRLADVVRQHHGADPAHGQIVLEGAMDLQVWSSTFSTADNADLSPPTLGQLVPAVRADQAVNGTTPATLIGLSRHPDFRTNIGVASQTGSPLHLTIDLVSHDGAFLGRRSLEVAPFSFRQLNDVFSSMRSSENVQAWAVVQAEDPEARYVPYASVIDNRSGDPITVLPVVPSTETMIITAAAHTQGINNTRWRTDLDVVNPGPLAAEFVLELVAESGPSVVAGPFRLESGRAVRYDDVVGGTFGVTGNGAVRIVPLSGTGLVATARTYSQGEAGTMGQGVPAVLESSQPPSGTRVFLPGLRQAATRDTGFRTNLGLVNLAVVPRTVTMVVRDRHGNVIATRGVEIPATSRVQLNEPLRGLVPGSQDEATVVLTGTGPFLAHASLVDNRTGDAVHLPAMR